MSEDIRKTIRLVKFDRNLLSGLADQLGAGKVAVEKDFLISTLLILLAFDEQFGPFAKKMVFRGGTCIKKAYYPKETRFSEDLDFTSLTLNEMSSFFGVLEKLVGQDLGVTTITRIGKTFEDSRGLDIRLDYTSVLGQPNHIGLNLSTSKTMKDTERRSVDVMPYFPLLKPTVPVMDIREILAEKMRALLQRTKPRDVFDIWFLAVKKRIALDHDMLKNKLQRSYEAAPKEKKDSATFYSSSEVVNKVKQMTEIEWKQVLGGLLLSRSPSRETVVSKVSKILERIGDISLNPTKNS